jgi:hypothetical protein
MNKLAMACVAAVLLSACGKTPPPRPVEVKTQIVQVEVPAPCPAPAERERLRQLRPQRLADQPMPATARERVAKTSAQLGRYEAPGGYADQVDAALDRCQRP